MNIKEAIKLMRPQQWFKSASIFFGIVISIFLYEYSQDMPLKIIIAFVATSILSSAAYVLNDLADMESDRKHPTKKYRPLASGKITTYQANFLLLILIIVSLSLLFYINPFLIAIGLISFTFKISSISWRFASPKKSFGVVKVPYLAKEKSNIS